MIRTPWNFLIAVAGLLVVALAVSVNARVWRSRAIYAEARRLGLQFSRPDRFLLGRRVVKCLPIPGAAEVLVRDVAYRTTDAGLLCVMTASFTIGTVGRRRYHRRVVAALDPGGKELEHFHMQPGAPNAGVYAVAYTRLLREVQGGTAGPSLRGEGRDVARAV